MTERQREAPWATGGGGVPLYPRRPPYADGLFDPEEPPAADATPPPHGYACLDLGGGRIIRTKLYLDDDDRRQFALPVNNYELFDQTAQRRRPLAADYRAEGPAYVGAPAPPVPLGYERLLEMPRRPFERAPRGAGLFDCFLRDWAGDAVSLGRLRPERSEVDFGQPASPGDFPTEVLPPTPVPVVTPEAPPVLAPEPTVKKRIVAEVKPMRPSYSAVLSKTPKVGSGSTESPTTTGSGKRADPPKEGARTDAARRAPSKAEPTRPRAPDAERSTSKDGTAEKAHVNKRRTTGTRTPPSSGSDSGERPDGKPAPRKANRTRAASDDSSNDGGEQPAPTYSNCDSEFVLIDPPDDEARLRRRTPRRPTGAKAPEVDGDAVEDTIDGADDSSPRERGAEVDRSRRKGKDSKGSGPRASARAAKRGNQPKPRRAKGNGYLALCQTYLDNWTAMMIGVVFWFYDLVADICRMSAHLSADLFSSMCTEVYVRSQNLYSLIREKATYTQWMYNFGNYIDNKIGHTYFGFWRKFKWFKSNAKNENETESQKKNYTNIPLPATGEDAMKRLLACKGKDPYSILGVGVQCTDDDIKRYYRRQAFLVHPDKNQQPGAEEAFKILQHAFDMIGEPERREAYEQRVLETRHAEAARSELADLVARLQEKVRRAASTIRCSGCSRRHPRTPANRPCYAARYCSQCNIHHSAKEGDIWAESSFWGLIWMYYACMDGAVYEITQWASCQKKNLKHLKANTHNVQYRIVLGNKPQQGSSNKNQNNNINDADLEDFLSNLYTKSAQQSPGTNPGKTMPNPNMPTGETMKSKRKNKKSK